MALPVPSRQEPGLEVPVFLDIESRAHRVLSRALRRAVKQQTSGLLAAARDGDLRGIQDRINAINLGPAAESVRGDLELVALNAAILGAAQFVDEKKPSQTKFVRDREFPQEARQAVTQVILALDGSQTENVRREAQRVADELEARREEGAPGDTRVLKQVLGGMNVGELAAALNAAVDTGSTVQAGIAANLITTRMAAFGALSQAQELGIGTYQWNSVLDTKTCPFCRGMNGKTFKVGPALNQVRAILLANDPNVAKALSPWPQQTADNIARLARMSNGQLQQSGFALPPAHPLCRCVASRVGTVPQEQIKGFIVQALRARTARQPIAEKLIPQGVRSGQATRGARAGTDTGEPGDEF